MPSIFSRSSRSNHNHHPGSGLPQPGIRLRTDPSGQFLETSLGTNAEPLPNHGYLSPYPSLTLSITHLHLLVEITSQNLDVSTPFVFSADAIDLDAGRVRRLIDKFVNIVVKGEGTGKGALNSEVAKDAFLDEARFAGPHELGMLLRWGLARVVRVETTLGSQTFAPGALIPYLAYLNWAAEEHRSEYPPAHFARLLDTMVRVPTSSVPSATPPPPTLGEHGELIPAPPTLTTIHVVPPQLKETLLILFALLSRLVAHSAKSGHTPPTLSPLFGVLVFGLDASTGAASAATASGTTSTPSPLGPNSTIASSPSSQFTSTYTSYLRATHAMEHLLLAYIRWQDTPVSQGGGAQGSSVGGVPTRCKEWIKDYPRGLSNHASVLSSVGSVGSSKGSSSTIGPRKGTKTLPLISVRRVVPLYERDLVGSVGRWDRIGFASTGVGGGSHRGSISSPYATYTLAGSTEWERISPVSGKDKERLPPRYSDSYKKRMNIPPGVEPSTSVFSLVPLNKSTSSMSSSYSSYSSAYPMTSSYSGSGSMSTYTYGSSTSASTSLVSSPVTSPSTPNGKDSSERFKTLTDAQWGLFESSGFSSAPGGGAISISISTASGRTRDIDSALKFDLTESARKARLGLSRSASSSSDGHHQGGGTGSGSAGNASSWGDFVNAGFDARERDRVGGTAGLSISTASGPTMYGVTTPPGSSSSSKSPMSSSPLRSGGGGGGGYLDTEGKPTDVGEFTLDTGLDAALQFNLAELGGFGVGRDRDRGREKERERERTGSFGLAKRLKKKEKPLPPFTHDTTPLLGSEAIVEAAFVDVWVDLVCWGFGASAGSAVGDGLLIGDTEYSMNGSMALTLSRSLSAGGNWEEEEKEREKERERERVDLFKECNWVLVEFKALPSSNSTNPSPLRINTNNSNGSAHHDPRISTSLLLFEEFVPREYRAQLAHQIFGLHPSVILNPSVGGMMNANSSSSSNRVRLGSLFASSGSTLNMSSANLSPHEKGGRKKDKDRKKKDKLGGGLFSGSTRTLGSTTTLTPSLYDSRNGNPSSSTPTPYDSRSGATPTPIPTRYDSRADSRLGGGSSSVTPYDSRRHDGTFTPTPTTPRQAEFDAMLADRGTKVIRLNRDGSQRDRDPEKVDYGASPTMASTLELEEDEQEEEDVRLVGLPEGAMAPKVPPLPAVPTVSATAVSPAATATPPPAAAAAAATADPSKLATNIPTTPPTTPLASGLLFSRLPSSKPKGPKDRSTRRQSRQNLVPAEYHTVEFETRLTSADSSASGDDEVDGGGGVQQGGDTGLGSGEGGDNAGSGGDGFLEEAAKRRKAARLAERDKMRSERRGKRFSLGILGSSNGGGGDNDDDDAWVDIVVPGYGGTPMKGEKNKNKSSGGDPEEASAEVARVLSAVRGGQPYPLDGDDEDDVEEDDHGLQNRHGVVVQGGVPTAGRGSEYSDDIEVQMVPHKGHDGDVANGLGHDEKETESPQDDSYSYNEDQEEDEDEDAISTAISQRRLGYFDLHPERRPVSQDLLQVRQPDVTSSHETDMLADNMGVDDGESDEEEEDDYGHEDDEDDPRARYEYGSDEEHDVDAEITPRDLDKVYSTSQTQQKEKEKTLRPLPTVPFPSTKPTSSSPPVIASSSSSLTAPAPAPTPVPPPKETTPTKPAILNSAFGSTSGTPGKTAALIEMYREREKKSTTSPVLSPLPSKIPALAAPVSPSPLSTGRLSPSTSVPAAPVPAPSRIPTKAGLPVIPSLNPASVTSPSLPTSPAAPAPAAKPLLKPIPTPVGINSQLDDTDEDEDDLPPPGKLALDDGRSSSPGRYIHGAPLHNVMEEEEEE